MTKNPRVYLLFWLTLLPGLAQAGDPPVAPYVWREAVVSVTDLDRTARFFVQIGNYEVKWRGPLTAENTSSWQLPPGAGGEALLLGPAGYDNGLVRLIRFDNAGRKRPMRPGSRAWDTGCYFSLMVRMKGMPSIYDDAIELGWWTETPITYLEFGQSKLNIMIFRGPDGLQLQGYERLTPPLPDSIPAFQRMTGPFNVMQMVRDRDQSYRFFTEVLGLTSFYHGKPYLAKQPQHTPLGIPYNLTTSVRYRASIVYPIPGEFGRMEMIEIMDLEGRDHADHCVAPNLGILAVRFPVDSIEATRQALIERGATIEHESPAVPVPPYGSVDFIDLRTPDGALIQFFTPQPGQIRHPALQSKRAQSPDD